MSVSSVVRACRLPFLVLAAASALPAQSDDTERRTKHVDWDTILHAPRPEWPKGQAEVTWRTSLPDALRESEISGRPLFVTLRCLPCKQCSEFDKGVLEGGSKLTPLLARFITVRITDASKLDLTRLPAPKFQDFDLSWWGYFLSDRAELYSVFGGRDEVSDKTRISTAALANVMRRVLDHHYAPKRDAWKIDLPVVAADAKPRYPESLPGYSSWQKHSPEAARESCLHCHMVADILRQPAIDEGSFDREHGVGIWPLPENLGLSVDRDDGLRVTRVRDGGPAARAGLAVGDVLAVAGGRRLFGQTDLRGVLHRSADPEGKLELHWLRDGKRRAATLDLPRGWRKTVLDWRMSISQGNIGIGPGFFPLRSRQKRRGAVAGMWVTPFFGPRRSRAWKAGMRQHHVITAVDGESPALAGRAWLVWFRLRYRSGERVEFSVLDRSKPRKISFKLGPDS